MGMASFTPEDIAYNSFQFYRFKERDGHPVAHMSAYWFDQLKGERAKRNAFRRIVEVQQ